MGTDKSLNRNLSIIQALKEAEIDRGDLKARFVSSNSCRYTNPVR